MSDAALVIGIDGGQTSVKGALATLDGDVLAEGRGSGLLHLAAADGPARMSDALGEALSMAWRAAGLAPRPVAAIALGLTGVEAGSPEERIVRDLLPSLIDARYVDVQNDGVAALVGAHLDGPGVIVISGTGMIAHGKDSHGRLARVGGWGWLLGDEGGAVAIGRDGLIAALHAGDGVAPATTLQAAFLRHFGVDDPRAIKPQVFRPDFGAAGFAALAPVVATAAQDGDSVARAIIDQAGRHLAREVVGLTRRLDFGADPLPVAPVGGGFAHLWGLRASFTRALADAYPRAVVVDPVLPPVLGAVLMAVRAAGGDVAAAAHRLRAQSARAH